MASRLSPLEREQIGLGRAAGESLGSIARRLGRSVSTISREVGRFERYGQRYQPLMAQWASFLRHNRSGRVPRLAVDGPLRQVVLDLLRRRRSPQQISARLRVQFPDTPEMWVSHETIYQAIYLQARGNLRAELTRQVALRSGRAARRRRAAPAGAVCSARPWVNLRIAERPAEVADRAVPGHWEGDLL
ncbi:IS30 family transposase, partial [Micromonospora sp. NPDC051227]|uniref:IS30 family transposase n=1 Tax=Micromonospora sp. NPDC051227 TaxID=3364285 RepID=UPI0037AF875B